MKNLFKNPILYVAAWFAVIGTLAALLSSCATHYVGCDAYGLNDGLDYKKPKKGNVYESGYEIMTPGRAEHLAKIKDK
jgi:hypothetical protein